LIRDLIRAPFVIAAAHINDEPSPLVRQRKAARPTANESPPNRPSQAPDAID
jgi:hypothetical protein